MRNCKNYEIYKFQTSPFENKGEGREKNWARAQEHTKFKVKLLDAFSGMTSQERWDKFGIGSFDEAAEVMQEKTGVIPYRQWRSMYWCVPKDQPDLVKFFEENKPSWVTKVSKV